MTRKNRVLPALIAGAVALGLSGCYSLTTAFSVDEDGAVTMTHRHMVDSSLWDSQPAAFGYVEDFYSSETYDSRSESRDGSWVGYQYFVAGDEAINNFAVTSGYPSVRRGIDGDRHQYIQFNVRIKTQVPDGEQFESRNGPLARVFGTAQEGWTFQAWSGGCSLNSGTISCATDTPNQDWLASFRLVKDDPEPLVLTPVPGEEEEPPEVEILSGPEEEEEEQQQDPAPAPSPEEPTSAPSAGDDGSNGIDPSGDLGGGGAAQPADDTPSVFEDDPDFAVAFDSDALGGDEVDLEALAGTSAAEPSSGAGMWAGIASGVGLGALVAAAIVFILKRRSQSDNADSVEMNEV